MNNTKQPKMLSPLTTTQLSVLEKLAQGSSTAQIAKEKAVSENTVNTHIKAIYSKLDINTRPQAVRKAIENGII